MEKVDFTNIILFLFFLYHGVAGCCSLGPRFFIEFFSKTLYSFSLESRPSLNIAVKAVGAFAVYTSLSFLLVLCLGEEHLKVYFVLLAGLLTGIRFFIRLLHFDLLQEVFGLSLRRNQKHLIFNFFVTVILMTYGLYKLLTINSI